MKGLLHSGVSADTPWAVPQRTLRKFPTGDTGMASATWQVNEQLGEPAQLSRIHLCSSDIRGAHFS